jgi:hypothetical protein
VDWKARLPILAAALWWGSLSAIGLLAVPLLFANASSPAVAGSLAAKLFTGQSWLSVGCGMVLLMGARGGEGAPALDWARGAVAYVLLGMLPALYAIQWLCALVVVWKVSVIPAQASPPRG